MTMGYFGTDWEANPLTEGAPIPSFDEGDLWPNGVGSDSTGGDKDALGDGYHAFQAVGQKDQRAKDTLTGVLMTIVSGRVQLVTQHNFAALGTVANVLTYLAEAPATFKTSIDIGDEVYLDDSDDLSTNVCLSFSPLNDQGATNPKVGIIFYDQDEYDDTPFGGEYHSVYPVAVADEFTEVEGLIILLK